MTEFYNEPFIQIVIVTSILGSIGLFFAKLWYDFKKDQHKLEHKDKRTQTDKDLESQLNDLIDNAPRLKAELDRQIQDMRSKNVTDQQMSGMLFYKQIVDLAASNPQLAQIIGKPLVKGIVSLAAKIPKIIGGLTSL
jgi:hypothetical protein